MRNIDTLLKKTVPVQWYGWKEKLAFEYANKSIREHEEQPVQMNDIGETLYELMRRAS